MKLILRFEVDVDEDGLAAYLVEYPAFADEGETPAQVLIREAIENWDFDGLILPTTSGAVLEQAAS